MSNTPNPMKLALAVLALAAAVLALAAYLVATPAKPAGPLLKEAQTHNAAVTDAWEMFR